MKNILFCMRLLSFKVIISASSHACIKDGKVVQGCTIADARSVLREQVKPFNEIIDQALVVQANKSQKIHNKEIMIDINHVVNLNLEIKLDRTVTLEGGHMYKVLANFSSKGGIQNPIITKDTYTNCADFKGVDAITGQVIHKTTFPQGWTPGDINHAIATSSLISSEKINNKLVSTAMVKSIKKNPEFIIQTISYPIEKSNTYQMITAYPVVN